MKDFSAQRTKEKSSSCDSCVPSVASVTLRDAERVVKKKSEIRGICVSFIICGQKKIWNPCDLCEFYKEMSVMIKEPWKTVVQIVITILTALTTTVSANASGLTSHLVAMI